jgi:hypothetical protein
MVNIVDPVKNGRFVTAKSAVCRMACYRYQIPLDAGFAVIHFSLRLVLDTIPARISFCMKLRNTAKAEENSSKF